MIEVIFQFYLTLDNDLIQRDSHAKFLVRCTFMDRPRPKYELLLVYQFFRDSQHISER
jgi:hypothetical protein